MRYGRMENPSSYSRPTADTHRLKNTCPRRHWNSSQADNDASVGRRPRAAALKAELTVHVVWDSVQTSGACDVIEHCTPYGAWYILDRVRVGESVLVSSYISFEDAVTQCAHSRYGGHFDAFRL